MFLIALQHRGTSGGSAAEDAAPPGPAMERGRSKTTPSPAGPARDSDLSERCLPDRTETHARRRSARRDAAARKTPAGRAMVFSTRSDVKGSPHFFLSFFFYCSLAGHCASAAAARGHRRSTGGGNLSAVTAARGQRESPLALQIATALLCLPDLRRRAALW